MHFVKIATLALLTSLASSSVTQAKPIRERMIDLKDRTKEKLAALLVFWGDESHDARIRRLKFYIWLEKKDWWMRNPKKWFTWIATGNMPVKQPDSRISDEEYVQYYLIYKELAKGAPLTREEQEQARKQAMELMEEYRRVKGVR